MIIKLRYLNNITHRKGNKMSKTIMAAIFALSATAVSAEGLDLGTSIALEHEAKGEINNFVLGNTLTGLPLGLEVSTSINLHDTEAGADFTLEDAEFDVSKSITDSVTAYVNTDLNQNVERTETTVGIKLSF